MLEGTLAEAIKAAQPDILHVHWLNFALDQELELRNANLPMTVRLHGFEVTEQSLLELLQRP